eukprot:15454305-Alexandrium_andersonii.AAC.1
MPFLTGESNIRHLGRGGGPLVFGKRGQKCACKRLASPHWQACAQDANVNGSDSCCVGISGSFADVAADWCSGGSFQWFKAFILS